MFFNLLLIFLLFVPAAAQEYTYKIPEQTDDGWQTAHVKDAGINETKLTGAVNAVRDKTYPDVHSILIVKDGKLVFEEYFPGYKFDYFGENFRGEYVDYGRNTIHNLASVTKSFTSALVGITIDKQKIKSVNEKMFSFFPEYGSLKDEKKDKITLAHLLTMTSGLEWNEADRSYADTTNDLIRLFFIPNPVEYILKKPSVNVPASRFYYNGGGVNLLGEIIRKAAGLRMDAFAKKNLFEPLGIADYEWDFINPDMIHASGNLKLKPRDMAKFGFLYINDGKWKNNNIISEKWIKMSLKRYVRLTPETGYGFNWWQKSYSVNSDTVNSFYADGWGGQKIFVFSELNTVVVFTGGNYTRRDPCDAIIRRFILPAVLK